MLNPAENVNSKIARMIRELSCLFYYGCIPKIIVQIKVKQFIDIVRQAEQNRVVPTKN